MTYNGTEVSQVDALDESEKGNCGQNPKGCAEAGRKGEGGEAGERCPGSQGRGVFPEESS